MTGGTSPGRRRIALCADDFGLGEAASRAILELGASGAISATSVAVDGPAIAAHVAALKALRPRLAVGLHLNLTEPGDIPPRRTLHRWIVDAWLRRVDPIQLAAEIERQLDRFETLLGRPDYVDGHEHVHQFPVLRELLLESLEKRYGTAVAVRCTWPRLYRGPKAAVIGLLGARGLSQAARRRGLRCNTDFAGVYDLRSAEGYGARMAGWLRGLDDGGLLMCHPETLLESASPARVHEYQFLRSPEWPELLAATHRELVPPFIR